MKTIHKLLHSLGFAFAVGGAIVSVVTAFAYLLVGWLGIALVGLTGLYISTRIELNDGNAVADFDYGGTSVKMLAKQIDEQRRASPRDRVVHEQQRKDRKHLVYLMNTLWLAMIGCGFVLFTTHQI